MTWSGPLHPNGLIRSLTLTRDSKTVFSLSEANQISNNIFFIDEPLRYGQKYTYVLRYDNDVGFASVISVHETMESTPDVCRPIKCLRSTSIDIDIAFEEPEFPNGNIIHYSIRYWQFSRENESVTIDVRPEENKKAYTWKISELKPYTK